jgi:hypothetical protein
MKARVLAVALATILGAAVGVERAQAQRVLAWTTPWGDPDLQGTWTNATTTPLERSDPLGRSVLSDAEASSMDAEFARTCTACTTWWEKGATVASKRTSIVIDPADGRIPALTPEGQRQTDARAEARRGHGVADSWEDRPLQERCLLFHGVPPLPTNYNNNYQILQTSDVVAIVYEMIHEARIIPLDGRAHLSPAIAQWMGDSRGRFEGDTLVVETTNFSDKVYSLRGSANEPAFLGTGKTMRVIERFRRVAPDRIDYHFTIDDPATYSRPWTGWLPFLRLDGRLYEYACHEGNSQMSTILAGARRGDRAAQSPR